MWSPICLEPDLVITGAIIRLTGLHLWAFILLYLSTYIAWDGSRGLCTCQAPATELYPQPSSPKGDTTAMPVTQDRNEDYAR